MGTWIRAGRARRLTPAPAQSAAQSSPQTAFLFFATIECAASAPLLMALMVLDLGRVMYLT
jgi:hypothetical protein